MYQTAHERNIECVRMVKICGKGRPQTMTAAAQPLPIRKTDMPVTRDELFKRLDELGISTKTVEHAPMFTVEQSQDLRATIPGGHTKNLFLKDKDGRLALVIAKDDTKVDLKALAKQLDLGRFSFGKPDLLMDVLGVEPGLSLIHI